MITEYSVESLQHLILSQHSSTSPEAIAALRAFQQRLKADEGAVRVTERLVRQAENARVFVLNDATKHPHIGRQELNHIAMRSALIAVWPNPPAQAAQVDFPACSGDPSSCPENDGYGCCKAPSHDPTGGIGLSRFQAQFDDGDEE